MVDDDDLEAWFCREVLPLERALTHFIHRNWRVAEDVTDLRHDVYQLAIASARKGLPVQKRPLIFPIARNHLINRAKRAKIVSFEPVSDQARKSAVLGNRRSVRLEHESWWSIKKKKYN